jgi:heterodisulfide reductase subunit C
MSNATFRDRRRDTHPRRLTLKRINRGFCSEVKELGGSDLSACVQCQKCTSGCPVAARADLRAHELVRMVQLGQRDLVLGSRMIWECTSCQTCRTRCPQSVDIASLNDALRRLSREAQLTHDRTTLPIFNDAFLRSVRRRGRVYEVGLMAVYKLRTLRLMEDMEHLPTMLLKRKLRLLPTNVPGKAERKRIFARARARGARGQRP